MLGVDSWPRSRRMTDPGVPNRRAPPVHRRFTVLMVPILAIIFWGCHPDEAANRGDACPTAVRLVVTLGSLDDPDGILGERDLYVVGTSGDEWVVLEPLMTRVLRYGADGSYLGTLGRSGPGPGELSRPLSLALHPDGDLWVSDSQGRWVVFGPDGEAQRTLSTPAASPIQGINEAGEAYALHLAVEMTPVGEILSSGFLAHRWDLEGERLDPVGPGVDMLVGNPRVMLASSPHRLLHQGKDRYVITANFEEEEWGPFVDFPGAPAVHVWEEGEARILADLDDLMSAPGLSSSQRRRDVLMKAIGPSAQADRLWAFGHLKREGQPAGLDLPPGEEGTLRNSPALRNRMFEGVAWLVGSDGSVSCAVPLPMVPDGVVGADTFFSVREDESTGAREIVIWSLDSL